MAHGSFYKPGVYAAIDIGTVTCRLLIARIDADGALQEILRETNICNLGMGVDSSHRLMDESIERTVTVLSRYSRLIEDAKAHLRDTCETDSLCVRIIATSASRDAENADVFQKKIVEQTTLDLDVIPGEEEAMLSFTGASSVFPGEQVVVLDIGGGSTEIIAGQSGEAPTYAHSFDIGCRRITERYLQSDPPAQGEIDAARAFISSEMKPYLDLLGEQGFFRGRVVAVAGTATSAVSMRDQMVEYDPQKVHGSLVTQTDVDHLLARLSALTLEQRKHVIGLEPERAGVVIAGLIILQTIMELAKVESVTVSEYDILQGIILNNACS